MYDVTINSLHLFDPITYLGYVKRANLPEKKTLIYFPEVQLIEKAKMRLQNDDEFSGVAIYHGRGRKPIRS